MPPTQMCHQFIFAEREIPTTHVPPLSERHPLPTAKVTPISTARVQRGHQVGVECRCFPRVVPRHTNPEKTRVRPQQSKLQITKVYLEVLSKG